MRNEHLGNSMHEVNGMVLTDRQYTILEFTANGISAKGIAEVLGLSVDYVNSIRESIIDKNRQHDLKGNADIALQFIVAMAVLTKSIELKDDPDFDKMVLSKEEERIAAYLVRGVSLKVAAIEMDLPSWGLNKKVSNLRETLGARNNYHAAALLALRTRKQLLSRKRQ